MININDVYLQYGDRILFDHIYLTIGERDKIGLVGRNGAGKSTLLKMIAGQLSPDSGAISKPNGATLGFLHQDMMLPKGKTVLQEAMTAFEELQQMEQKLERAQEELTHRTDYETDSYHDLVELVSTLTERFHFMGGSTMEANAVKVLHGLGFATQDLHRLTDEFSGGWQMRVGLGKMLLRQPDFLLLDEPTNHLDIESILWLESFLKGYPGSVIIISHDKQFLDNVTNRTIEIELGKTHDYKAAYSKYVELRRERRELQQSAYENQQRVIADKERTINRFMAKATKTKMAQSMQKQLDKMERVEIDLQDTATMKLNFPPAPRSGQIVLNATHVSKRYGQLLVLDDIDLQLERGDRVAFVGQNGQGKTTLAKILINVESASSGNVTVGHNVQIGYYAQNQAEALTSGLTLLQTMEQQSPPEMRTRLRAILGAFMFSGEDVDKKVSVLSGGERARLALACLLLKPFNLLVLDEPTNHLDMLSKEVLKKALLEYDGSLIVVSHDRDFLQGLTNQTIEFRDHKLHTYIGDVNAFLEKRALDNMRQVEMRSASQKVKSTLSEEDRRNLEKEKKRLQRVVQNSERKIETMELELKSMEKTMGEPSFYDRPDSGQFLNKYQDFKKELDAVMAEWETALMELDEAEGMLTS